MIYTFRMVLPLVFLSFYQPIMGKILATEETANELRVMSYDELREDPTATLEQRRRFILLGVQDKSLCISQVMQDVLEKKISLEDLPEEFINYQDPEENNITPLMWLIDNVQESSEILPFLKRWLQLEQIDADLQDNDGRTSLMCVSTSNLQLSPDKIEVFNLLLKKDPDIDLQDRRGNTLLMRVMGGQGRACQVPLLPLILSQDPELVLINDDGLNVFDLAESKAAKLLLYCALENCKQEFRELVEKLWPVTE